MATVVMALPPGPGPSAIASAPAPETPAEVDASGAMVAIPPGTLLMGSREGVGFPDEHPQHPVRVAAFCLDVTEVTVAAYTACVAASGCTLPGMGEFCNGGRNDRLIIRSTAWTGTRLRRIAGGPGSAYRARKNGSTRHAVPTVVRTPGATRTPRARSAGTGCGASWAHAPSAASPLVEAHLARKTWPGTCGSGPPARTPRTTGRRRTARPAPFVGVAGGMPIDHAIPPPTAVGTTPRNAPPISACAAPAMLELPEVTPRTRPRTRTTCIPTRGRGSRAPALHGAQDVECGLRELLLVPSTPHEPLDLHVGLDASSS